MRAVDQEADEGRHIDQISNQQLTNRRGEEARGGPGPNAPLRLVVAGNYRHQVVVQVDVAHSLSVAPGNPCQLGLAGRKARAHVDEDSQPAKKLLVCVQIQRYHRGASLWGGVSAGGCGGVVKKAPAKAEIHLQLLKEPVTDSVQLILWIVQEAPARLRVTNIVMQKGDRIRRSLVQAEKQLSFQAFSGRKEKLTQPSLPALYAQLDVLMSDDGTVLVQCGDWVSDCIIAGSAAK